MRFDECFEVAAGSVSGRTHTIAGKTNQDAYAVRAESVGLCGVVCDGCGSGKRSEVGASLGARIICENVLGEIKTGFSLHDEKTWERIREKTLDVFKTLAHAMGGPVANVVADYFLFTVVGLAMSAEGVVIFGIGDGTFVLNGKLTQLGPFPGNAPPYLGYGLLGAGPSFLLHRVCPLETFESALIATDGLDDYLAHEGKTFPAGRGETVRPLSSFWQEDKYFQNPDVLRRTLSLVNREITRPIWNEKRLVKEPGLLEDDTTLLVVRKKSLKNT
jgi:Protein phosphatase 2C